jgi:hypothetical protein
MDVTGPKYTDSKNLFLLLYHRERICFSSTLSCIKEKITKPPNKGLEPPANQVSKRGLKIASESSADTHPSTHLGHGGLGVRPLASLWTFGDHPGRHTEVRIKQDFTSVPESSWLWGKLHQKVQLFHREGGGMVYWPACWVAYKRKSRRD